MQTPTMVCYHGIQTSYAVGDAATVTVVDADLNTDSSLVEVYVGDGSYTAWYRHLRSYL